MPAERVSNSLSSYKNVMSNVTSGLKNALMSMVGMCACGTDYVDDDGNTNHAFEEYTGSTEFVRSCEPNLISWISLCRRLDARVSISSSSRSVFKFLKRDYERTHREFHSVQFFLGGDEGNLLYGGSLSLRDVRKLNMMTLEERVFFFESENEALNVLQLELHSRLDSLNTLESSPKSKVSKIFSEKGTDHAVEETPLDLPFIDVEDTIENEISKPSETRYSREAEMTQSMEEPRNDGYRADNASAIETLAFHGIGQYYLTRLREENLLMFNNFLKSVLKFVPHSLERLPPHTSFKIDLSSWNKYSVRSDYERYGITAFFGEDKKFIAFFWPTKEKLVCKDDPEFQKCALILRSTLYAQTFLRDSLCELRWGTANSCLLASERCLGHLHCIRRLLKPYTYQLANVNLLSLDLWGEPYSLAYRAFAFTERSWQTMLEDAQRNREGGSLNDRFLRSELREEMKEYLPMYKDGLELWRVVHKFVTLYLHECYPNHEIFDSDEELQHFWTYLRELQQDVAECSKLGPLTGNELIAYLSNTIFWVVAGGSLFTMSKYPDCDELRIPMKVSQHEPVADVQTLLQTSIINKLRRLPLPPLVDSWYHMISEHLSDAETEAMTMIYRDFQIDLRSLSERIGKSNKYRDVHYSILDPLELRACLGV